MKWFEEGSCPRLALGTHAAPNPDYSTLSLRERTLEAGLGAKLTAGMRHVLMAGSTGLKVFG